MELNKRVDRLNSSSWDESLNNIDKAFKLANEALKISKDTGYNLGICHSFINLGWLYISKSNYTLASYLFKKSRDIANDLEDYNSVLKAMTGYSACNYYWGNYATCIDLNIETVLLSKKYNDRVRLMTALTNSSSIYIKLGNKEKSMELALEAITVGKEIHKSREQEYVLSKNLGDACRLNREYVKSEVELLKSCSISWDLNYLQGYYEARCSLGKLYSDTGRFGKAAEIFKDISDCCRDMLNASDLFLDIGNYYFKLKEYQVSLEYLDFALVSGKKYNMNQVVLGVYELYIKINEIRKNSIEVNKYLALTRELVGQERRSREEEKKRYHKYYSFIN